MEGTTKTLNIDNGFFVIKDQNNNKTGNTINIKKKKKKKRKRLSKQNRQETQ